MNIKEALMNLIYPAVRCLACDEPRRISPGSALCDDCAAALKKLTLSEGTCLHCLSPRHSDQSCRYCLEGGMQYFSAAYAPFRYHGVAQKLIVSLKFQGVHLSADPLAEGMLNCLDGRHFDAMVPVPLHRNRLRERGFNQSALLCERLAKVNHVRLLDALERLRDSKRQSSLAHDKRGDNVKDIFGVVKTVKGLRILLVDDVRTTGHTARACAKALLEAGAGEVCLLTATVAAPYSSSAVSSAGDNAI